MTVGSGRKQREALRCYLAGHQPGHRAGLVPMSASALLDVLKTHSVASAWPAQSASAAATSCSVKNGLPSARAYPSSANWAGADPPARAATCSAVFSRESGPSRISSTSLPPRIRQPRSHHGFKGPLITAARHHHRHRTPAAGPPQVREAVQRRTVGPVHVLDHQHGPGPASCRAHKLGHCRKQPLLLPLLPSPARDRRARPQLRQQPTNLHSYIRRECPQRGVHQPAARQPGQFPPPPLPPAAAAASQPAAGKLPTPRASLLPRPDPSPPPQTGTSRHPHPLSPDGSRRGCTLRRRVAGCAQAIVLAGDAGLGGAAWPSPYGVPGFPAPLGDSRVVRPGHCPAWDRLAGRTPGEAR